MKNVSTYSKKLSILMKILKFVPFMILEKCGLGYYVKAELSDEIDNFIKRTSQENSVWNVIVGTYDKKQKIVIQLWRDNEYNNKYYKIGNKNSNKEMINEIGFLKKNKFKYETFNIPNIVDSQLIESGFEFNIQLTDEFIGKRVEPIITEDIYKIYKEIVESKDKIEIDGVLYGFSHGDFAPWNIKKDNTDYIIFDWEHCGFRFYGFDLIHYLFQIENLLNNKSKEDAIELAMMQFNKLEGKEIYKKEILKHMYFEECKKSY